MDKVEQVLHKLFEKHRIVFWYDDKGELRQEFDELWLTGVDKVKLLEFEEEVLYSLATHKAHIDLDNGANENN